VRRALIGARDLVTMKLWMIRHGRSAHVHAGWIDVHGFRRWREAYEAAGISDSPPPDLRDLTSSAGVVVTSDILRATESARALAPNARVIVSPLLRELTLEPPNLSGLRLPLSGWMLAIALRMLVRAEVLVTAAERKRIEEAARWLQQLGEEHGTVVIVTHGSFRWLLAKTLQAKGWTSESRRLSSHWSAWCYSLGEPRHGVQDF
jgi:broad specificity phosphatase PhoE